MGEEEKLWMPHATLPPLNEFVFVFLHQGGQQCKFFFNVSSVMEGQRHTYSSVHKPQPLKRVFVSGWFMPSQPQRIICIRAQGDFHNEMQLKGRKETIGLYVHRNH